MNSILASVFRAIFKITALRKHFYGVHKRFFKPSGVFKGISKKIIYRNGIVLDLDINDWIQQNLYFLDQYEEKEIRFLESLLKPGDLFIDVGANIGLFSLVASAIAGESGKVYAFEPYSKNFDKLLHHVHLNRLGNVVAERLAVSDKSGWIDIRANDDDNNDGMISAYVDRYTSFETVPTIDLDQYIKDKIKQPIRFVKIDIEGGEYLAVKGMSTTLAKDHPVVMVEINPDILSKTSFTPAMIEDEFFRLQYSKYFLGLKGQLLTERAPGDSSHNYVFKFDHLLSSSKLST